ncbi:MAG: NAD(P)-dependent oxidoreductase [Gemmatimonadetes bacterium]|nr:NAD(P)-dependent oxidoreductase [Gemmatimonadota bacterium]
MRVFLTGGSGLVGSHVAERLRAGGHTVVALQRPGSDTVFLESLGCEIARGDLLADQASLASMMEGCRGVVHSGAVVYGEGSWEEVRAVNVGGTARVLGAAGEAGVTSGVHLSSVAVYGDPPGPIDEQTPTDSPLRSGDMYARSKREAEVEALTAAKEGGIRLTILRPPALYGERDRLFVPKLVRLVGSWIVPVFGTGRTTLAVVYAGNVAAAIEQALTDHRSEGLFNLTTDHLLTPLALLMGIAEAVGANPRFVHLPASLVRAGARVGDRLGVRIPNARDLPLARVVRLSLENNPYRSDRIREVMGWSPSFTHEEGMARTGAWLASKRRLDQ